MTATEPTSDAQQTVGTAQSRHGRTALVVLAMTVLTTGAFAGVAYGLGLDTATEDALLGLMYSVGGVGVVWSMVLAVRALRQGEPVGRPVAVVMLPLWGLSVPLMMTWVSDKRGRIDDNYLIHVLCLPVIVPMLTLAATTAFGFYIWKRLGALRVPEPERPARLRAARIWFVVSGGLLLLVLSPFFFYAYGGSMNSEQRTEPIGSLTAVKSLPRWMGDVVYRVWKWLPASAQGSRPIVLVENGLISGSLHRDVVDEILRTKTPSPLEEDILHVYMRDYPQETVAIVLERAAADDLSNPFLDYFSGRQFVQCASSEQIAQLCRAESVRIKPTQFQLGIVSGLRIIGMTAPAKLRAKAGPEVIEAARIWSKNGNQSLVRESCCLLATIGDTEDALQAIETAYAAKFRWGNDIVDIVIKHVDRRRGEVWERMLTHPDINIQQRALGVVAAEFQNNSDLLQNQNLPKVLEAQLASPDGARRVTTALIILALRGALPDWAKTQYFRRVKFGSDYPNDTAIESATAAEQAAVIEEARAALKKW